MPNSGKQEENENKIKCPSGKENDTVIVGLEVYQKIKDKLIEEYEMDAKGRLAKAVNFEEYIKIKAYNNKDLMKNPEVSIKNEKAEEIEDGITH